MVGIESILRNKFSEEDFTFKFAVTGKEAISHLECEPFDLLILDLGLPDLSGLEVLKEIRKRKNSCKVIIFSSTTDDQLLQQLLKLNCTAIIKKSNSTHYLTEAVKFIHSNPDVPYLDPAIQKILQQATKIALSPREYEIVTMMSQGKTSQEIADIFNCSLATIKTHRMRIMNKSGARNASEILAWFLSNRNSE